MPEFTFGKVKAEEQKSIDKVQSNLDTSKANTDSPTQPLPTLQPMNASGEQGEAPMTVQGIGPSAVGGGTMLEPAAPTGRPSFLQPKKMLDLTDEELEFIQKRRQNSGFVHTEDIPPTGNPRIAGGSDIFSSQSDKAKMPTLTRQDGTTRENKPAGVFAKLGAVNPTSVSENPDFIPGAESFVGQRRRDGEKKFSVQLVGCPVEYVFAHDRLEAQYRYAKRLGIISTIHPYTVTLAE